MKLIDLEAHFLTRPLAEYADEGIKQDRVYPKLVDLEDVRLKDMDEAGIDIQVLSLHQRIHVQRLDPAVAVTWARSTNEELSTAVEKNPERFLGLAALPLQHPYEAARELERAVRELGLKGACILSNVRDEYYDNAKYWGFYLYRVKLPRSAILYLHIIRHVLLANFSNRFLNEPSSLQ